MLVAPYPNDDNQKGHQIYQMSQESRLSPGKSCGFTGFLMCLCGKNKPKQHQCFRWLLKCHQAHSDFGYQGYFMQHQFCAIPQGENPRSPQSSGLTLCHHSQAPPAEHTQPNPQHLTPATFPCEAHIWVSGEIPGMNPPSVLSLCSHGDDCPRILPNPAFLVLSKPVQPSSTGCGPQTPDL